LADTMRYEQMVAEALWKKLHRTANKLIGAVFTTFILPKFGGKGMTSKQRRINALVTRRMRSLNHYKFRAELLRVYEVDYEARDLVKWSRTRIVICDESWTTRCCGCCGFILPNVGAVKVIVCPHCKHKADRDGAAARKIMIKVLFAWEACGHNEYQQTLSSSQSVPSEPFIGGSSRLVSSL